MKIWKVPGPRFARQASRAALACLVAVTIMHKHNLKISFAKFVAKALPYALMHIILAVGYVLMLSVLQGA